MSDKNEEIDDGAKRPEPEDNDEDSSEETSKNLEDKGEIEDKEELDDDSDDEWLAKKLDYKEKLDDRKRFDDDDDDKLDEEDKSDDDGKLDEEEKLDGDEKLDDEEKLDDDEKSEEEEKLDDDLDDEEEDNKRSHSDDEGRKTPPTLYDFDIMMAKKKEENSRKKRRRNFEVINDNDDIIADIINQMKDAMEADIESNKNRMPATCKLKLLPFVMAQIRKVDLRDAFLDSDVLSVFADWLSPLPDKSLPHFQIREGLFKTLIDLNLYDVDRIKASGIGKAVMYLYKHPKETKENKQKAKQLINCWSRPIFQVDIMSREEREERDLSRTPVISGSKKHDEAPAAKPGDKGWIPRARVPAPSMKDYVVRPRSKVEGHVENHSKRPANILESLKRRSTALKRAHRTTR